jgi:type II secretory pathway pseudopilin PulG
MHHGDHFKSPMQPAFLLIELLVALSLFLGLITAITHMQAVLVNQNNHMSKRLVALTRAIRTVERDGGLPSDHSGDGSKQSVVRSAKNVTIDAQTLAQLQVFFGPQEKINQSYYTCIAAEVGWKDPGGMIGRLPLALLYLKAGL